MAHTLVYKKGYIHEFKATIHMSLICLHAGGYTENKIVMHIRYIYYKIT